MLKVYPHTRHPHYRTTRFWLPPTNCFMMQPLHLFKMGMKRWQVMIMRPRFTQIKQMNINQSPITEDLGWPNNHFPFYQQHHPTAKKNNNDAFQTTPYTMTWTNLCPPAHGSAIPCCLASRWLVGCWPSYSPVRHTIKMCAALPGVVFCSCFWVSRSVSGRDFYCGITSPLSWTTQFSRCLCDCVIGLRLFSTQCSNALLPMTVVFPTPLPDIPLWAAAISFFFFWRFVPIS